MFPEIILNSVSLVFALFKYERISQLRDTNVKGAGWSTIYPSDRPPNLKRGMSGLML